MKVWKKKQIWNCFYTILVLYFVEIRVDVKVCVNIGKNKKKWCFETKSILLFSIISEFVKQLKFRSTSKIIGFKKRSVK